MSKYLFDTICPSCGEGKHGIFYHSCGGKRYIDDDLYLHCDKCKDKTFIFNSTFKCENHNDFRNFNKFAFMKSLALVSLFKVPERVIKKMTFVLMNN